MVFWPLAMSPAQIGCILIAFMSSAESFPKVPCPKCGRPLSASGELTVGDSLGVPTYQCDECLVDVDFAGETLSVALTFAVGPDGQPFDPADPEGRLRF